ncbi:MAG: nitroreductase family protein [Novosphingobium sp.]
MTQRSPSQGILPILSDRWSPRSFDGSPLSGKDLALILEAASLAPSAFNYQPWAFLYALRGDPNWDRFLSLLIPFNQSWAKDSGALVFIVSDTLMRKESGAQPSLSHSFDCGAAWVQAALQATAMGYHTHAMSGIDFENAVKELCIPDGFRLEAAFAIGRKASPERLPEGLREREAPSARKPLDQIAVAGNFRFQPGPEGG